MTLEDFLSSHFERATKSGAGWAVQCPAHEDSRSSMVVTEVDGKILVHCHAGCSTEDILMALGLTMKDLFVERIIDEYLYTDEEGKHLSTVVRFEPKAFRQKRLTESGWVWNLQGVRRVLYHLPEVIASPEVIFVEGEKDVETLRSWGYVATTSPGGAGSFKAEYADALFGKYVTIIADADDAGRKYADAVGAALFGKTPSLGVIYKLPGGAKDVTEWKEKGGTAEKLGALIARAGAWMPPGKKKDEVQQPAAVDVEKDLLLNVMGHNEVMPAVMSELTPEDFFDVGNREVYEAMVKLASKGEPIIPFSIEREIGKMPDLPDSGGVIPHKEAIKTIRQQTKLRKIVSLFQNGLAHVQAKNASPGKIAETTVRDMLELISEQQEIRVRTWKEVAHSLLEAIEREATDESLVTTFKCGIPKLDMNIGLRRSEVLLLVGQTSHGKTMLGQQFATQSAKDGFKVLFFSAEMTGEQLMTRHLSQVAKIPFWNLRSVSEIMGQTRDKLEVAVEQNDFDILFCDKGITTARIVALTRLYHSTHGLDLIIIDYDQLVIGAEIGHEEEFWSKQSDFIIAMKQLAQQLDIAVVVLAQPRKLGARLSLTGFKSMPSLDDIFGHSAMKNTPSQIVWLVREFFRHGMNEKYEGQATAFILKNRNGRTGLIKIRFESTYLLFEPAEEDVEEESHVETPEDMVEQGQDRKEPKEPDPTLFDPA